MKIRSLNPEDFTRWADIHNQNYPDYPCSVDEIRHEEESWPKDDKYERHLLALEDDSDTVVGVGLYRHLVWRYDPRKYEIDIEIARDSQHRGYGSALYNVIVDEVLSRDALSLRAEVNESMESSVRFLRNRDFKEIARDWESRLQVKSFDFSVFVGADERFKSQGFKITTLADEMKRDPEALRKAYDFWNLCDRDVPSYEPGTDTPYESYVSSQIESPVAMLDAYFLAKHRDLYVGQSVLNRSSELADVYYQELTGVRREYRGRGIATALKLQTVRYALDHGIREIRTSNSSLNEAMLRINVAMGFERQPAWLEMLKEFGT